MRVAVTTRQTGKADIFIIYFDEDHKAYCFSCVNKLRLARENKALRWK